MANKQIPTEFFGDETPMFRRPPESPIQALMEADFGHEPEESAIELMPYRELVAEAVDMLDEETKWVINGVFSEQLSLQQLAGQLGVSKTHIFRIRNRGVAMLRALLSTNPQIRKRVNMSSTWEESATEWVNAINSSNPDPAPIDIEHIRIMRDALFEATEFHPAWSVIAHLAIGELKERDKWDTEEMIELLIRKQRDYGHQNILQGGGFGVAVRLSDKIERYANLTSKESLPSNESIIDTLLDMVGYSVIAHMLADGSFTLPLGNEEG